MCTGYETRYRDDTVRGRAGEHAATPAAWAQCPGNCCVDGHHFRELVRGRACVLVLIASRIDPIAVFGSMIVFIVIPLFHRDALGVAMNSATASSKGNRIGRGNYVPGLLLFPYISLDF